MEALYTLNPKALWAQFRKESFAFWMVCLYLFLQYFDPLQIYHRLASLPLDKVAIGLAFLALPIDPARRRIKDSTNIWITLFFIVLIAASAFADYPAVSFHYWFDFFNWYVIYFLIINTVTTKERFFLFLTIFLLANFKMSFFGARTWAKRGFGFTRWGLDGPPGFFQNSSDFSGEMLMFAPIAFELALFVKPYVRRVTYWFLMLGSITGVMSILGASDRGSQVALAFQGTWVAIQRKLKLKILLGIAVLGVVGYALLPAGEKARFSTAGTDRSSIQRLDYWKAGWKMMERHPVLGVGYFNFAPVYASNPANKLWDGTAQLPHNIFIQVGTDAGFLGLAIFLILLYRNLKLTKEIRRLCKGNDKTPGFAPAVARGLALTLWGFVIAGQFNTVTYYPYFWINLAMTVSLASIVRHAVDEPAPVNVAARRLGAAADRVAGHGSTERDLALPRKPS